MSKNFKKIGNYCIGVDIGTDSEGWSVIDDNYALLKYHGKYMLGASIFPAAEDASKRRAYRTTRRRYCRRRNRILLLQQIMFELVSECDSEFFKKLNDSFYTNDDKAYKQRFDYFLKRYKFKSIYHLRDYILRSNEKVDIRLIYLAIHHIMKYRGNFLYEDKTFNPNNASIDAFLEGLFQEINDTGVQCDYDSFLPEVSTIITDISLTKSKKKEKLCVVLSQYFEKNFSSEFASLILGYTANITKMFDDKSLVSDDGKDIKIQFSSSDIDIELENIVAQIGIYGDVLVLAKTLYDGVILRGILSDSQNISSAMIKRFDEHKKQLKILKKIIFNIDGTAKDGSCYFDMFKSDEKDCSYTKYINNVRQCDNSKFSSFVKVILDKVDKDSDVEYLLDKIENKEFLPTQNDVSNSVIPYQINLLELEQIIDNQGKFYPSLSENKENIVTLLTFRIPYYVGPLSKTSGNKNAWFVRKSGQENVKITPWNFDDVIDKISSGKMFIQRMLNNCTYLPTEHTMPKKSLTCQKYEVINELANIRYDDKKLGSDLIKRAVEELFMKNKVVTISMFEEFLRENHIQYNNLSGNADMKRFMSSMSSYIDFSKIFINVQDNFETIEKIINSMSVLNGKILAEELSTHNIDLSSEQIETIKKLAPKYKGWSSVSKKLVDGIKCYYKGVEHTILSLMQSQGINFIQAISSRYGFKEIIEKENKCEKEDITYEDVNEIATSPKNKRGIWQAIKIVKEIVKIMGCAPKLISIEFAKGEENNKKRTISRYEQIKELYKSCKKDVDTYNKGLLSELEDANSKELLSDEKYFLYFLQHGRSLYSQKPIDINCLDSYDVDHILPRSLIKDDSMDNKALVLNRENKEKSNKLTLDNSIIDGMRSWWNLLRKNGLMSEKKYKNLCRPNFSNEDIQGFIAKQLVETRQVTKHVARLLQNEYPNSKVLAIKAGMCSNFKRKYDIIKIREINDVHHAIDAYSCAFLGNFVQKVMPEFLPNLEVVERNMQYKITKLSDSDTNGYILNRMDNDKILNDEGEIIYEKQQSIHNLLNAYKTMDAVIVKKTEEKSGQFFKVTLNKKSDRGKLIPIKKNMDTKKYGGYTGVEYANFVIVSYMKNNKLKNEMFGVPIYIKKNLKDNSDIDKVVKEYLVQSELDGTSIENINIVRYINIYQKARFISGPYLGQEIYIAGQKDVHNAKQLYISERWMKFIKYMPKYVVNENEFHSQANEFIKYYLSKVKNEFPLVFEKLSKKVKTFMNEKFEFLTASQKQSFISKIIQLTKCGSVNISLTEENDGICENRVGRMLITFNDELLSNLELVFSSATGLNRNTAKI